jgi:hypothetical protein
VLASFGKDGLPDAAINDLESAAADPEQKLLAVFSGRVAGAECQLPGRCGFHPGLDWLEKASKTEHDLECPHGVQFYDVVIEGERHRRAAWSYESPQPKMEAVRGRFGFWEDVQVG